MNDIVISAYALINNLYDFIRDIHMLINFFKRSELAKKMRSHIYQNYNNERFKTIHKRIKIIDSFRNNLRHMLD